MLDCDEDELISKPDVFQFFIKSRSEKSIGLGKKMSFIEENFDSVDKNRDGLIPFCDFFQGKNAQFIETVCELLQISFD